MSAAPAAPAPRILVPRTRLSVKAPPPVTYLNADDLGLSEADSEYEEISEPEPEDVPDRATPAPRYLLPCEAWSKKHHDAV